MLKKALAIFAIIVGLALVISPASAQNYRAGVATGGTQGFRDGATSSQGVYEDQCRRIGAYNHPMCMTGNQRHGQRYGYGPRPGAVRMHGGRYRQGNVVVVAPGAYQERLIQRAGGSTVLRAGPKPVPSPEAIAKMAKHKTTYTAVPCIDGYVKNEANGQCDLVSWVPGPDPE